MDEDRATFPVGVNAIVVRDGKLLLGKRKNVFGDGSWGLPGGHLEDRESMLEAMSRELMEETGLRAESFTFAGLVNNLQRERQHIQVSFLAEHCVGEPELREPDKCSEWRWFDLTDMPQPIFIGHVKLIELYQSGVGSFAEG